MKKVYWRPTGASGRVLLLVGIVSLSFIYLVETFTIKEKQPYFKEKIAAAKLAKKAFESIALEKKNRNIPTEKETDPTGSGLIGVLISPVTSNSGSLQAKQTTINPNFAAVFVQMLKKAGVKEGDVVACGLSGSFPAINISLFAALQTLKLKAIVISSVSASQWGANQPDFLWIDMEDHLVKSGIFKYKSVAASFGGIDDKATGISIKGKEILESAVRRNGVPLLSVGNFKQNVDERMKIYQQFAEDAPVKVYVNTGGGSISVGKKVGKNLYNPGLNKSPPPGSQEIDSVMNRYIYEGIPVIHFVQIETLAKKFGLPVQPQIMPSVGEGIIYIREEYNRTMAGILLVLLIILLFVFHNTDIGHKLLSKNGKKSNKGIEPMI